MEHLEFPCEYPIKVMGPAAPDFREFVVETVTRHAADLDESLVRVSASRGGRFLSVTVVIRATGEEQLVAITRDLQASGRVRMIL